MKATMVAEARRDPAWAVLGSIPFLGPVRIALILAIMRTPWRFRTKRNRWTYCGLAVVSHSSSDYEWVDGQVVRRRRAPMTRGLNRNCNRELKDVFKGAATAATGRPGPLLDYYEGMVARGMRANMRRHEGLEWEKVRARLESEPDKLWSLSEMERSGGEPDVIGQSRSTGEYLFFDCSPGSPQGRRSVRYDRQALEGRKKHKPRASGVEMATEMGVVLLTEDQYRRLQQLGPFDTKTSSWLQTPPDIRRHGGAIFGDHRYGTVFVYHNGAES